MRSIIAIALIFSATFAGANALLAQGDYQAITKDRVEAAVATSRAYVSTVKAHVVVRSTAAIDG